jgi:Na+/pantothenate symporter
LAVSLGAFALAYSLLVPIGLYARFVLPPGLQDTDRVVPELLATEGVFPGPVAALLLVAMVAAAMSSLDSVLLVVASTFERDVLGLALPRRDAAAALRATRIWVAVFAAITAAVALDPPGGIVSLTAFSGSLYAACFFPAVVLGLHWRRGDGAAALASFATGIGVLLVWPRLSWALELHRVFPALALSTLVYAAVAVARRSRPPERVARLFDESPAASGSPVS